MGERADYADHLLWLGTCQIALKMELPEIFVARTREADSGYSVCISGKEQLYDIRNGRFIRLAHGRDYFIKNFYWKAFSGKTPLEFLLQSQKSRSVLFLIVSSSLKTKDTAASTICRVALKSKAWIICSFSISFVSE